MATYTPGAATAAAPTISAILENIRDDRAWVCFTDFTGKDEIDHDEMFDLGLEVKLTNGTVVKGTDLSNGSVNITTSASSGGNCQIATPNGGYGEGTVKPQRNPAFACKLTSSAASSALKAAGWGYANNDTADDMTTTTRDRAQFRQVTTGALFFVTGNTGTEETTDVSGSHTLAAEGLFDVSTADAGVTWIGAIAGVTVATHTTTVPTVTTPLSHIIGIRNNTTTDLNLASIDFMYSHADRD